jgi:membrane fusion protein (multidrug efflux system)
MSEERRPPAEPQPNEGRLAPPADLAEATPTPSEPSSVRVNYGRDRSPEARLESAGAGGVERSAGRGRSGWRFRWRGPAAAVVVVAALLGMVFWWVHRRLHEYTDNAYVVANITPIGAEISGPVVALYVDDNMLVQPGQPIAQIDPVPFQVQVDQAMGEFQQADYDFRAAVTNVGFYQQDRKSLLDGAAAKQAEAQEGVNAAEYELRTSKQILEKDKELLASLKAQRPGLDALMINAKDYLDRFNRLASAGDIPVQDRDNREATYRDSLAKLRSLESNISAAERQVLASELQDRKASTQLDQSRRTLDNARAAVGRAQAAQLEPQIQEHTAVALQNKLQLAEAKLRLSRLHLSYTLIRAPIAGIISRRTIQLGQTVEARRPFLSIVPLDLDNVWIVANMREEQMARLRVGQRAWIGVDGIPDQTFAGWVESVAGGTGAVFSLFPPDNATGNFVRIVQRLPVRIRFSGPENYQNRVRPGMSCRIWVDTTEFVRQSSQHW